MAGGACVLIPAWAQDSEALTEECKLIKSIHEIGIPANFSYTGLSLEELRSIDLGLQPRIGLQA